MWIYMLNRCIWHDNIQNSHPNFILPPRLPLTTFQRFFFPKEYPTILEGVLKYYMETPMQSPSNGGWFGSRHVWIDPLAWHFNPKNGNSMKFGSSTPCTHPLTYDLLKASPKSFGGVPCAFFLLGLAPELYQTFFHPKCLINHFSSCLVIVKARAFLTWHVSSFTF